MTGRTFSPIFGRVVGVFAFLLLAGPIVAPASAASPSDADAAFFETKIRPVLVDRCYQCHSAAGKTKGGLTVDSLAALLKGGDSGPSIVSGDPAKSKLVEAVGYANVDLQMPPKGKLTDAQIADLTEWVKRGAPWPGGGAAAPAGGAEKAKAFDVARRKAEHWAWQPVRPTEPPAVKDESWPRSDVDRFLLAKMEEAGLKPGAEADRRTLIRRASLVVTGLPPTPDEVEAFVADGSPDAFATVVDRLLGSPRFGERWGRHWLDLVRYADSRGHEFDYDIPTAWRYRDYVIRAFNADVPYDRFVREHVAGDLLPNPRLSADGKDNESVLGTGFWFLSEWLHSPVDIRQDETDRIDNQVDVFGKTFLGLTIGCARCHDHKFDAISAADYYALSGFVLSSGYREVRFENEAHNAAVLKKAREAEDAAAADVSAVVAKATAPVVDRLDEYLIAAAGRTRAERRHEPTPEVPPGLDAAIVTAWATELAAAEKDDRHPLHPFAAVALTDVHPKGEALSASLRRAAGLTVTGVSEKSRDRQGAEEANGVAPRGTALSTPPLPGGRSSLNADASGTIVDYGHLADGQWIAGGDAFGDGPAPAGTVTLGSSADRPITVSPVVAATARPIGVEVPGLLRTPTFAIDRPWLLLRIRGTGQATVVIDSYRMMQGPLHNVARQKLDSPNGWGVHVVDLCNYLGHRAHVEFTPADPAKPLAVQWARLSADGSTAPEPSLAGGVAAAALAGDVASTVADLAKRYRDVFFEANRQLAEGRRSGKSEAKRSTDSDLSPAVADWMASRLDRFGYGPAAKGEVAKRLASRVADRRTALANYRPSAAAMAMLDGSGVDEKILIRGSPKSTGEVVPRRFLEAIDGPAAMKIPVGSGRLQLAERVVDPANPLAGRVMVNRVWHHLFGRGIVASVDNFGVLGDRPTHPELLDRLTADFESEGWSVKRLVRKLMLTRAWQLSSHETAADATDPQNLLLHRANLRRLEGEAIRDEMLWVSGRLDETMFGPPIEVHLTPFMDGRGRPTAGGPLDGGGRRSVYTAVRRNFLPPMMLAFDTPAPFNTMGRRTTSNVPAQALILMNDPFVRQQAERWADRTLNGPAKATAGRIDAMYRQAFARRPTEAEVTAAAAFLASQAKEISVSPDDRRCWADLAHVLMNVKEFVYVP